MDSLTVWTDIWTNSSLFPFVCCLFVLFTLNRLLIENRNRLRKGNFHGPSWQLTEMWNASILALGTVITLVICVLANSNWFVLKRDGRIYKHYRREKRENHSGTVLLKRIHSRSTWRGDLSFSDKYFSVHDCFCWKLSGPRCATQDAFTPSAVQTTVSKPGDNWSLCWYHCRAFVCILFDVCCERKMGYLLLRPSVKFYHWLCYVFSIFTHSDHNKYGQTSSSVAGA